MQLNPWALTAVVLVAVQAFYLGSRTSRFAGSTQDFLVARRTVRSRRNAAAISGEFLSAASFLGVAGVVLKDGADGLWYSIGFAAGYLTLMLFVAAPLRRSGAYTPPDFLQARLGSVVVRRFATTFMVCTGVIYFVPQLQAAGLVVSTVLPVPAWVGAVFVAALVLINVLCGGMRAITLVQAFHYWVKLSAISVPAFVHFSRRAARRSRTRIASSPSSPEKSAWCGSWSRASGATDSHASSGTYGGLHVTTSTVPARSSNAVARSPWRRSTPVPSRLRSAQASASSLSSTAWT